MKSGVKIVFLLLSTFQIYSQAVPKQDSITVLKEVLLLEDFKEKHTIGIVPSQIIGEKIFQNFSPVDAVSAINQIPGVYILSGALNTNRITIRGVGARTLFGTDKLRLYYNEIPVTNGSGFSTIEAFDLENLSQVEVVKGPKSTSFGANLGGAILLNSKDGLGKATSFQNNTTIGSYNLFKNNLSILHSDDRFSLGLSYGHLETDGYRDNNAFERDGVLLNTSYKINPNNTIGFLLNYIDYTAQIPSSLGETAFNENPEQAAFTWNAAKGYEANKYTLLGVSYDHRFSSNLKNTTSIFYTYLDHYEPRPFGILDEFTNGFGFRSNFTGNILLFGAYSEYSLGAELYKDEFNWGEFDNLYQENNGQGSLQGDRVSKNKEFRTQLNTFGSLNISLLDKLQAQVGLALNNTQYDFRDLFNTGDANKSAARKFKTILLPSLNLNYRFSEIQMLYANISRGFSNPTLEETLTPDGVINPDIKQETGINYELGTQLFLLDKKLNIQLALYQMDINNLLVAQRVGDDEFIGKNAGETKHQGVEVAASLNIELAPVFKITPFVNYTFSDHSFIDFVDGDSDFSGNPLPGVPKHRLNTGIQTQLFENFYWNSTHQFVGAMPLTDSNSLSSDSFHVFTTKIGYEKNLSDSFSIGLSFGINNVFNVRYAQSVLINTRAFGGAEPRYYYPGNNRNYYSGVRLQYSL